MGAASISHCLMTLNSSVNFFIYAFTSSTFRSVLRSHTRRVIPQVLLAWWDAKSQRIPKTSVSSVKAEATTVNHVEGPTEEIMMKPCVNEKGMAEMHRIEVVNDADTCNM